MENPSQQLLDTVTKLMASSRINNTSPHYQKEYEEAKQLTNFLPVDVGMRQRFWHILNNKYEPILCPICKNNQVQWFRTEYLASCSLKCAAQSNNVQQKRKKTMIDKYGVEYPLQSKEIQENTKQTNLDKYGTKNPMQSKEVQDKTKQTNLEKYGIGCSLMNDDVRQKRKDTMIEKYGAEYTLQSKELSDKVKNTNMEKYGVENPLLSPDIQKKAKNTIFEKYGVKNILQLPKIKDKVRKSNLKKYGRIHPKQTHITENTLDKLLSYDYLYDQHINKQMTLTDIAKDLGVGLNTVAIYCKKAGLNIKRFGFSSVELEVKTYINTITNYEIISNSTNIIHPYELDIYIPELKLAFEYNGIYWHSDLVGIDKNYHSNKTKMCQDRGIRLVHIFENEWATKQDIVKSRISNLLGKSNRIYARKCKIVEVTDTDKTLFLSLNHIQGNCPSSVNLGLEYDGNLVAIMTFGKSRFSKKYEWELLRYTNILNTSVVGGASKLFNHFVKTHIPKSIISYSDKRWNTGELYKNIGFIYSHTSTPNFFYFHKSNPYEFHSRIEFQKFKLSTKLESFDPNLTAYDNMVNNGWNRIWDCGNDVFVWAVPYN